MTMPRSENSAASLPVVAIVGRPNVGKSAIFNRLAGRRISIVHEQSGVTRDRVACEAAWGGKRFQLVDTGGLDDVSGAAPDGAIQAGIRRQVETAVREAAAAILVTDVLCGVTALDEDVAGWLRQSGRPVYTAANKCDNPARDRDAVEFARFAFPVFPVSALQNRGFEALLDAVVTPLPAEPEAPPLAEPADAIRVAVVGRPNVGKSSFVNRLLRAERVIVSEVPGTTIDSIDIPFTIGSGPAARRYVLTDTAGLRPEHRPKDAVGQFSVLRAERTIRDADVVLLLLDAVQGPTVQDKRIAAHVLENHKGCVLLVNKWDLAGATTQREYEPALRRALPFLDYVPILFLSALSGFNVRQTVAAIDDVARQIRARLATGPLNRAIIAAGKRVAPPSVSGRRLKIYYAVQVGVQPIRIALFVNDPRRLAPAYATYLVRSLRETFGLAGAPILLEPKARTRAESKRAGDN